MSTSPRRDEESTGAAARHGDAGTSSRPNPGHGSADHHRRSEDPDRPATYREVFASREYRAVFASSTLSWIGDYVARVAITYLIFSDTRSVLLSAAAFAISYLPWVAGGPVLAAISERYPYRNVMILCDLTRMVLIALLAIPAIPLWGLLALLFLSSLMTPPAQSARSAMVPLILTGDRYVVGLSVQATVAQAARLVGYAAGGAFATAFSPRAALLVNAAAFAISAMLIWRGVRHRPPAMTEAHRSHLLRETAEGFRVVFGDPVMRAIALLVFALVSVIIVPEGLAAAWSAELGGKAWRAGLMMASIPFGYVVGGLIVGRLMSPRTRLKLVRPLALMAPLALVPALLDPPLVVVMAIAALAGFGSSVLMPLNGLFVQVLPNAYRARAFGIMQGGMQMLHAVAVLAAGAIAERVSVPVVVGAWAIGGLLLIGVAVARWPSRTTIDEEVERVKDLNQSDHTADPATDRHTAQRTAPGRQRSTPATGGQRETPPQSPDSQPAHL